MTRLVERYDDGEFESVWTELRTCGQLEYPDESGVIGRMIDQLSLFSGSSAEEKADDSANPRPEYEEALEVVESTMKRVRRNLEVLLEYLEETRFAFELSYHDVPLSSPLEGAGGGVVELEEITGPLPLSLRGFYEEVGAVCLNGTYPEWPFPTNDSLPGRIRVYDNRSGETEDVYLDALWVDGPAVGGWVEHMGGEYSIWEKDRKQAPNERFVLDFAPDPLHKANVSGAEGPGIKVPQKAADVKLEAYHDWGGVWFVDYLRFAILEWGGFPGLREADLSWPPEELVERFVDF